MASQHMNQQINYSVQDLKFPIMQQQDHHYNLYTSKVKKKNIKINVKNMFIIY